MQIDKVCHPTAISRYREGQRAWYCGGAWNIPKRRTESSISDESCLSASVYAPPTR
ncbi:hypothetical protein J6590_041958 [Homalodisca vitripennis]|nr:hypothetical protein J6590_041958 [Homalodisca vitripennis]